jgi:7,8-dihydro-6-hydroxymethylpterin dimethyltransferase
LPLAEQCSPLPLGEGPGVRAACCCSPGHKTCVALLEITGACNLRCPVCFAGSPAGRHRPVEELVHDLQKFLAKRGSLDVLQLSGGEPLLHPQLLEIIGHCKTLPIEFITINTNGLELLTNEKLAAELALRKPKLEINFQIDGFDAAAHAALRGEDLVERKRAALEKIVAAEIPFTLVCTVARRINEEQLGDLLRFGMERPLCRGITFQAAVCCGRFEPQFDPLDRVTLADVVRLLTRQSGGLLGTSDFKPLPCSNPNCCSFTGVARPKKRRPIPLMPFFDYEKQSEQLADRLTFNFRDVKECCGREGRAEDFFRIVIKPFMDSYTYDAQRAAECCVHIIRPGGNAVSFCRYNTLERNNSEPLG